MEHFIEFLRNYQPYTRIVWFSLGIIGLYIMYNTRYTFYRNRHPLWWLITVFAYMCLGPAIFVFSLITLIKIKTNNAPLTNK